MVDQQESLFVIEGETGQTAPVDFEQTEVAVPLEERSVRLLNVISLLKHKKMLDGFVSFDQPAEETYGDRAKQVRQNARDRVAEISHQVKHEFAHASGHYRLIESGEDRGKVRSLTISAFSDFLRVFYLKGRKEEAEEYHQRFAGSLDPITRRTSQRLSGEDQSSPSPEHQTYAAQQLNNHEKLRAILNDDRAGFLPATNSEKSWALSLLDYISDPQGASRQLIEVFQGVQRTRPFADGSIGRIGGYKDAKRTVESIVYEIGDFAENALVSHARLINLSSAVSEVFNPRLSLELALGIDHEGYAELARFVALNKVYNSGNPDLPARNEDPMRTVSKRWSRQGPGKHKQIRDRYTTPQNREDSVSAEIDTLVHHMRVGEARTIIADAIENEERRAQFFLDRISEVSNLSERSQVFNAIIDVAEGIVGKHVQAA